VQPRLRTRRLRSYAREPEPDAQDPRRTTPARRVLHRVPRTWPPLVRRARSRATFRRELNRIAVGPDGGPSVAREKAPPRYFPRDWAGRHPRRRLPDGRSAIPVPGAPDAGAVAGGSHPAGLLRPRFPGACPLLRVALPAHRGRAVPNPGEAVV